MTAQEYIISTLKTLAEPSPLENIESASLEDAILSKVMSKKFRKLKADEDAIKAARAVIKYAVENNKPVTLGILFGGNKLWRFDEAPEVDWAELFSLTYYLSWMKTITSVYKYGAHFDFYSQDVSVESLNNVPRSETNQYSETFRSMLEWIKPYIPERVNVTYQRQYEKYDDLAEYDREIEEAKKIVLERNKGKLPELSDAQKAATELNVKLMPGQSEDLKWREKVELEHQAIFENKTLKPYLIDETIMPTCPTPFPGLIATGSTRRSIAKFWAGVGALEHSGDSYNELVLTPKQLEYIQFNWEEVHIEGLIGKNFSRVRVLKK